MSEQYSTALAGRRLREAITASDVALNLATVPTDLATGTYRFRIDAEILTGDYSTGLGFANLQRGLEGSSAAAHRAGVLARHVITGESIQRVLSIATEDGLQSLEGVRRIVVTDGSLNIDEDTGTATIATAGSFSQQQPAARSAAARLYLFNTFR